MMCMQEVIHVVESDLKDSTGYGWGPSPLSQSYTGLCRVQQRELQFAHVDLTWIPVTFLPVVLPWRHPSQYPLLAPG